MWNEPTKKQLEKLPRLYETETMPLKDKKIYLHFFIAGSDWYIAEYDGDDLFFGYAVIGGDDLNAEWEYVSFKELKDLCIEPGIEVDNDIHWTPCKAGEIEKIRT